MVLELVLAQCGVGPVLTQLAEGLMVSQCLYWPLVRDWILMWLVVVVLCTLSTFEGVFNTTANLLHEKEYVLCLKTLKTHLA